MSGTMRRDGFRYMSLDDFEELLADKPPHEKWELIGGRVVRLMVGARWEHKRIVQNLTSFLLNDFRSRGSDCRPYDETFFMKSKDLDSALLPDVMVRCGALEAGATSLHDPIVAVEVLSQGSESRDRIDKWSIYHRLPSLMHYAIVERDKPIVEIRSRVAGAWTALGLIEGLSAVVDLPAIGVSIPMATIYEDVFQPNA